MLSQDHSIYYMKFIGKQVLKTDQSASTILIRAMVGLVFISEGLQKFIFADIRGSGRFEKIGFPFHEFLGSFVGAVEIVCGMLVMIGWLTRLAAIPLIITMVVAIATTKIDILLDKGVWEMFHAARTDWAMLLGSIFLLIKGGGKWSVDKKIINNAKER